MEKETHCLKCHEEIPDLGVAVWVATGVGDGVKRARGWRFCLTCGNGRGNYSPEGYAHDVQEFETAKLTKEGLSVHANKDTTSSDYIRKVWTAPEEKPINHTIKSTVTVKPSFILGHISPNEFQRISIEQDVETRHRVDPPHYTEFVYPDQEPPLKD